MCRVLGCEGVQIKEYMGSRAMQDLRVMGSLLAFIAAQSSTQTRMHSAILVIDTANNVSYHQVHWLVRTRYLLIKASNDVEFRGVQESGGN